MKEKDVVKKCKDWLEANGFVVFKHHGGPFSVKGHSDLYGFATTGDFRSHAFFIEVKMPGRKPTVWQQKFLDRMHAGGAFSGCVHSVEELENLMNIF